MLEFVGLALSVAGLLFAFETPRQRFVSWFRRLPVCTTPHTSARTTLSDHDRQLVKSFRALFAESGLFRVYQGHDFLLPLKREAVVPLYTVVETWTDETHYFSNPELRAMQAAFLAAANELAAEIVRYTAPDEHGNVSVIPRHMNSDNLPSYVRDEARSIDVKLPAFLKSHEDLLALCNRIE